MAIGFVKAGPNEALIVSGPRKFPRVVVGGLTFVWPIIERLDRLSLEVMTLAVESTHVYTKEGVAVSTDGVAQVKVAPGAEAILIAAQQFLRKTRDEMAKVALQTMEGHQRAMLGTLLRIKPVLKLDNGVIVPVSSVRTKRKAIQFMFEQVATIAKEQSVRLAVAHAQVPTEMEELLAMARDGLDCEDIFQSEVGPVIGTHTGPGVLGMAVCPLEDVP